MAPHTSPQKEKIKTNLRANMNATNSSLQFTLTNSALLSSVTRGIEQTIKPVVQILLCQPLTTPGKNKSHGRYKLMISDGTHYMPCVTHEQLCVHFMDGTLKMHAIIELEEYTVQKLNDKEGTYCLGVFNVTALDHHADKIGEPKNIMRDLNRKSPPELL